jgi:plastocyanin
MTDSTRRRFLRTATTAGAAIALAGCTGILGEDDSADVENYSLPAASATVEVAMGPNRTNSFDPEIVRVEPGGTVTWTNESGNHSATAYLPDNDEPRRTPADAEAWDTGVIRKNGRSASHTFEIPGVYDYFCIPHESMGMVATVVVGDPDPDDQAGLEPPGGDLPRSARERLETLNARVRSALE